ncbi:MAG: hypothetical protein EZS28_007925 [Streblomastix strix]|uniref:Lebercilin domain-containing protein n=1 Tax=Streblomastix strix TaxID=222440 RepID=A0A5J4WR52_9EUKA|nr:MAG: hypothetical protein EZS28_007925 [Streblomastix strix]
MDYEPDFDEQDLDIKESQTQKSEESGEIQERQGNKVNSEFHDNDNANQVLSNDFETDISVLRKNNAIIRRELMLLRRTIEKTENQKNRTQQLQNIFASKQKELEDLKTEDQTLQSQIRSIEKNNKKENDNNLDLVKEIRELKEQIRSQDKQNIDVESQLRSIDKRNIRIEEEIKLLKLRNEHLAYSLFIKLGPAQSELELREIYDSKYKLPSNPPKPVPISKGIDTKQLHDPYTSPQRKQNQPPPHIQQQTKSQSHQPQSSALSDLHIKEIEIQKLMKRQDEIAKQKEKQFQQLQKLFIDIQSKNKDIEFQITEREKQIKDKEREKELLLKQIALLVNKNDAIQDTSPRQKTKKNQKSSKINHDDQNEVVSNDDAEDAS